MAKPRKLWIALFLGLLAGFGSLRVFAMDQVQAEESFIRFQHHWLDSLNRHGQFGEGHVRVEGDPELKGTYVARYSILIGPVGYEIKKTGQDKAPYIGILHYEERSYLSRGTTPEEAREGPFKCDRQTEVAEIFRYSDGKWVY